MPAGGRLTRRETAGFICSEVRPLGGRFDTQ
jgi:hypothetical protein